MTMLYVANEISTFGLKSFTNISTSEVEAKHSEVLKGTQATVSCVVKGLTKQLDAVEWEKPNSGGKITNNVDDYKIEVGTYQKSSHSQTTILTIPPAANGADAVYTCIVTSDEHKKTGHKTSVNSNVFSEHYMIYHENFCCSRIDLCFCSCCRVISLPHEAIRFSSEY
jgi:hypothetical protein